jgi:hypothetical protein
MEVARSSVSRRVKTEFVPDRMASEILAVTFERLTGVRNGSRTDDRDSEQAPQAQRIIQSSSQQEVMR